MRNPIIDRVRGLAIILVVVGHAIQYSYDCFDSNLLFKIIYSFHMPLFMFISGMVVSGKNMGGEWLKRRTQGLLIPFVVWLFLPFTFSWNTSVVIEYVFRVIKNPDCSNWFLWILYLLHLSMWIVANVSNKIKLKIEWGILLYAALLIFFTNLIGNLWFGIGMVAKFSIYYFAGYIWEKDIRNILSAKIQMFFGLGLAVIWGMLLPLWHRTGYHACFSEILIQKGIWRPLVKILDMSFDYMVGFGGIALSFCVIIVLSRFADCRILTKLGTKTLEIYLLHRLFVNGIVFENRVLSVAICTIVGLVSAYGIAYLFEKKLVGKLLFGK